MGGAGRFKIFSGLLDEVVVFRVGLLASVAYEWGCGLVCPSC
jgi:hypothetical protein